MEIIEGVSKSDPRLAEDLLVLFNDLTIAAIERKTTPKKDAKEARSAFQNR